MVERSGANKLVPVRTRQTTFAEITIQQYVDTLLPRELPKSNGKEDNAIKQRVILIQGRQESGKSNTARIIAQCLRQHYASGDVSVDVVPGEDFQFLFDSKWSHKPIQVKLIEDITDVKISDIVARDFFRIRHVMAARTGRRDGLCVLIFTLHSFYDMPISFRRDYDSLIIQSLPMGKSDLKFVEENITYEGVRVLQEAEAKDRIGIAVVTVRHHLRAIIHVPKATEKHRIDVVLEKLRLPFNFMKPRFP